MESFAKTVFILLGSLFGLMFTYVAASKYSQHKIDAFCASIGPATSMQDLARLAEQAGVELHGPMEMQDGTKPFLYAIAPDGFTMGDYACSIHGELATNRITAKRVGF